MPQRRTCAVCGEQWKPAARLYTERCPPCRRAEVAPTIERFRSMGPCCLLAYVDGRLAATVDANDEEALSMLRVSLEVRMGEVADTLHAALDELVDG